MADFPLEFLLSVKNEMGSGLSQASSQLKTLGSEAQSAESKVKQSGIGIGAGISLITSTFVNTINSVLDLKRQYQDLEKAQNNVKQSGFSLANAQGKLENATINLASAQKGGGKASALDLKIAHAELAKAIDKYGKNSIQAGKAQSNLNKLMAKGGVDTDKVQKAENNLARAKRGVQSATINEKEAQIELKRAYEDFYLQTIPTAVGVVGSLASAFQLLKGTTFSLGGTLSKFIIPLAGISLAFIAIKDNIFGFRDFLQNLGKDIGNAVPALKPFLDLLEAVGEAIGLAPKKKGNSINKAVEEMRKQLQPIIDTFKKIVDAIMQGNWEKAFAVIKSAAIKFWMELKKEVPFFGEVESLVNKLQNGNWKGAFLQIAVAAKGAWETLIKSVPFFGGVDAFIQNIQKGDWKGAFDVVAKAASGALSAIFGDKWLEDTQIKIQNFITQLQQIPEKLKAAMHAPGATVFSVIDAMIPTDVKNFVVWANTLVTNAITALGTAISTKLTEISKNFIDPFIAKLFDFKTWTTALSNQGTSMEKGGKLIFDFFMNSIFPKDQKTAANAVLTQANNLLNIWNAIVKWFETNLPDTTKAAEGFARNLVASLRATFTVQNFTAVIGKIVQSIKMAVLDAADKIKSIGTTIGQMIVNAIRSVVLPFLNAQSYIPGSVLDKARQQVQNLGPKASGFHGLVTGATTFTAGEKGSEYIDITNRSEMMSRKNSGNGGGGTQVIQLVVDGQVLANVVARRISTNQAVYR